MTRMLALCILLAAPAPSAAAGRLILIGGGDKPPAALDRFVEWSGGEDAKILIVTWATEDPQGAFDAVEPELRARGAQATHAVLAADLPARKKDFLKQLSAATGVFFSGGDQNRHMDVLRDPDLRRALQLRYREDVPFAGTSAGTAIMSPVMITGNGDWTTLDGARVETREGLGVLPGVILDQHFIRRQRMNRLMALVLRNRGLLGLGIDEDGALAVVDGRRAEALGTTQVVVIEAHRRKPRLQVDVLRPGDEYDLRRRRRRR